MLLIPCPHCGPREETEFRFGGELPPERDPAVDDAAWARYLFERKAARGAQQERWHHADGCGRWLLVERDSISHQVSRCEPLPPRGAA